MVAYPNQPNAADEALALLRVISHPDETQAKLEDFKRQLDELNAARIALEKLHANLDIREQALSDRKDTLAAVEANLRDRSAKVELEEKTIALGRDDLSARQRDHNEKVDRQRIELTQYERHLQATERDLAEQNAKLRDRVSEADKRDAHLDGVTQQLTLREQDLREREQAHEAKVKALKDAIG